MATRFCEWTCRIGTFHSGSDKRRNFPSRAMAIRSIYRYESGKNETQIYYALQVWVGIF